MTKTETTHTDRMAELDAMPKFQRLKIFDAEPETRDAYMAYVAAKATARDDARAAENSMTNMARRDRAAATDRAAEQKMADEIADASKVIPFTREPGIHEGRVETGSAQYWDDDAERDARWYE